MPEAAMIRPQPLVLSAALVFATAGPLAAADAPSAEAFLVAGELKKGEAALAAHLEANPDDDQARFGLGAIRFVRTVERLGQFLYRHGAAERARVLPFFRTPLPRNPDPEPTSYADYRGLLEATVADLKAAEETLAKVDGDVKLPIAFGKVRLDLNGDGTAGDDEALWRFFAAMNGPAARNEEFRRQAEGFAIAFDTGDVAWLRGYCHLLSALAEAQLAYDGQRWFDHCGHLLFAKAESPFPFLTEGVPPDDGRGLMSATLITDAIAAIHLMNLPVKEPKRLAAAREHLLAMTALGRESWDAILAETDDDREWLPNPKQTSVIGVPVRAEQIESWRTFLGELDALLNGETLIPFWRDRTQGVNLKRVFTEPRDFDLVLWVQGTAAAPYLEKGEITDPAIYERLRRVFGGEFIGFALWFN